MNIRPLARRALTSSPIVLLAVLALGGSAAAATNAVEGVWSFNGGSVAVQPQSDGTFTGTVVTETKFNECAHPAGEVMWTGMTQQPDGSFLGLHQWFIKHLGGGCEPDPRGLGPTAWRVLSTSTGAHFLKVCFSHPGTSQPKIAPSGSDTEATFGCYDSALIEPLPTVSGGGSGAITFAKTVVLPNAKACVSQTSLKVVLRGPKYDPLKEVVVKIGAKKVADVKGVKRLKQGITLKTLPGGTYKISVLATTVLNQHLSGSQSYKSCTNGAAKIKLHGRKPHRHA
jgi:hypothetical protein